MNLIRSYSELIQYSTFEDRYEYLRLRGKVGGDTFGFDRWINQGFYRSKEWREIRHFVIVRDFGCDLAVVGLDVHTNIHIHHMNPMTLDDIQNASDSILDPEFLISASDVTHRAIHYGADPTFRRVPEPRQRGDTKLW